MIVEGVDVPDRFVETLDDAVSELLVLEPQLAEVLDRLRDVFGRLELLRITSAVDDDDAIERWNVATNSRRAYDALLSLWELVASGTEPDCFGDHRGAIAAAARTR